MGIQFDCVDCGKEFSVDDHWAGKRAKCKACGNVMQVPTARRRVTPPPLPRNYTVEPAGDEDEGIPEGVLKLIGAILGVGLIACVLVVFAGRSKPAGASVADGAKTSRSFGFFFTQNDSTAADFKVIYPDRPAARFDTPGIELYPMDILGNAPGVPMHVQLYLPAGRHQAHSLPCVFIAPAGTRLLYGSSLGEGDSPEHVPYVLRGFAVLAYELSGNLDEGSGPVTFGKLKEPVNQFIAANGGLANSRNAVDFVLAKVPEVDPKQLFAAGHSSAATMALNAVGGDHRFRAVAAYAPECDVVGHWSHDLRQLNDVVPGAADLASRVSPMLHTGDIACPVLLFHADDDENVETSDVVSYAAALQSAGKAFQLMRVSTGGHYQSMIDLGIPAGINFFESQGARPRPPLR